MNIKAAIFDMDGTMVDSLILWDVFWDQFGKKYRNGNAFRPDAADSKAVRTVPLKDAMELIHNHYQLGESGKELLDLADKIVMEFYSHEVKLKEGVREFLEYCKENGVKMCVASATAPVHLELVLKRFQLESYFSEVFSCETLGVGKEVPDVFLLARKHLGTAPEETWVFEDSLVAIETATKLGMPTVGIYDKYNPNQERVRMIATEYIAEGESLAKLI